MLSRESYNQKPMTFTIFDDWDREVIVDAIVKHWVDEEPSLLIPDGSGRGSLHDFYEVTVTRVGSPNVTMREAEDKCLEQLYSGKAEYELY